MPNRAAPTAARPRYRAVFVSPHLDDAVFSCGGLIGQLLPEGPVLVLNVFTRYAGELKIHGAVMGAQRHEEERAAAQFLGFESRLLGELDAPFRRDTYRQLGKLFRPPCAADLGWLPELRRTVLATLDGLETQQIYAPLGVGWHVDHMLTHLVFDGWAGRGELVYYEDAPYCWIPHATRLRLDDVATYPRRAADASLAVTSALTAWSQATSAYLDTALMRNLRPWIIRYGAVPAVGVFLWRLMALHRRAAASTARREMRPVMVAVAEQATRRLEAMALYGSQFGEFFASRQACLASLGRYAHAMGCAETAVERYWRPERDGS